MSFELAWHDLLGAIGSLMIIAAFFFLQVEKLKSDTLSYSLLNGVGALLVIVSLLYSFNLAAFILEVFWLFISFMGLKRQWHKRKQSSS